MGSFPGRCGLLLNCIDNKHSGAARYTYSIFDRKVCKRALMLTLRINGSRLSVALFKYKYCDSFADQRGRNWMDGGRKTGGGNVLSTIKLYEVYRHISSFPKYVSHYTRKETESKYLGANLNLSKMYRLFKEHYSNIPVSKSYYKRIFYKYFNLRFKSPKRDTCKKCDIFKAKVEDADALARRFL